MKHRPANKAVKTPIEKDSRISKIRLFFFLLFLKKSTDCVFFPSVIFHRQFLVVPKTDLISANHAEITTGIFFIDLFQKKIQTQ